MWNGLEDCADIVGVANAAITSLFQLVLISVISG
jgi:hypothetical protein